MGNSDSELKVDPVVLAASCEALSSAAEHLLDQLKALDGSVSTMLTGWTGSSGAAYSDVWRLWLRGADEVEKGLAVTAQLLGQAGEVYGQQDHASSSELAGVYRG